MEDVTSGRRVMVVGHADGDGYLAAEQTRRNAMRAGAVSCKVFVHPRITSGYRFWERYLEDFDVEDANTIIFVDIMLNYKSPRESFDRIVDRAIRYPDHLFVVIDHHPVRDLPAPPSNVQIKFSDAVYDCCFGPPSDLMIMASICDRDEQPVKERITDVHRRRALGVTRAAADRGGLAGELLIKLLEAGRWQILEALGQEDKRLHRTVRGVRVAANGETAALQAARAAAGCRLVHTKIDTRPTSQRELIDDGHLGDG